MIAPIRHPVEQDVSRLARLLHFTPWVHRHLGWRDALDFITSEAFWLLENSNGDVRAALCAPREKSGAAWLRLFADFSDDDLRADWYALWGQAENFFRQHSPTTVAALVLNEWLPPLLEESGFECREEIISMTYVGKQKPEMARPSEGLLMRPMQQQDLPEIALLDAAAFAPVWQNPLPDLLKAYSKSVWAVVAEWEERPAGYLMAVQNFRGVHIARLAVHPEVQGKGIGMALCLDLLQAAWQRGWQEVTVNTQVGNQIARNLYRNLKFREEPQRYPVYMRDFLEER